MKHLLAAALLIVITGAQAGSNVNICTDANGHTSIGDTKPSDCLSASDAENIAIAAQVEKAAEEHRQFQVAKRSNANLLAKYPDEAAVEGARNRELRPFRGLLGESQKRLTQYALERKAIDNDLQFFQHREVPDNLQRRLDQYVAKLTAEVDILHGITQGVSAINTRYNNTLATMGKLWPTHEANAASRAHR